MMMRVASVAAPLPGLQCLAGAVRHLWAAMKRVEHGDSVDAGQDRFPIECK
jgi:hypothetical protein